MQGRNWIMILIAAGLGLVAVILANAYFSGVQEQQVRIAEQQKLARIVVASRPLEFGAKLAPENLQMKNFPADSVPQGAFRSLAEALKDNRVALRPIVPGEPVLASKVSGTDGRATLAALLPEGMRAVSIPINAISGVAGFVLPGTTVDVMLTRKIPGEGATGEDMRSDIILQNVKILAIDQLADEKTGEPKVGGTATVQVSLFDAQRLAIAQRIGELSLALRNVANDSGAGFATVTNRQIGGPRFYIAARNQPQGVSAPVAAMPRVPMPTMGVQSTYIAGPKMTVIRGVNPTEYAVGQLRGW